LTATQTSYRYPKLDALIRALCAVEFVIHLVPLVGVPADYVLWGMLGFPIRFGSQYVVLRGITGDAFRLIGPKLVPAVGIGELRSALGHVPTSTRLIAALLTAYMALRFVLLFRILLGAELDPSEAARILPDEIPPILPLALAFTAYLHHIALAWILPHREEWLASGKQADIHIC
jgi:hypothetical protein